MIFSKFEFDSRLRFRTCFSTDWFKFVSYFPYRPSGHAICWSKIENFIPQQQVFQPVIDAPDPWCSSDRKPSFFRPQLCSMLYIHNRASAWAIWFLNFFTVAAWLNFHSHRQNAYFEQEEAQSCPPNHLFARSFAFVTSIIHSRQVVRSTKLLNGFASNQPQKIIVTDQESSLMDHEVGFGSARCFRKAMKNNHLEFECY